MKATYVKNGSSPGFRDCNGDLLDGCESSLSDPATCGSCTNDCRGPRATARCAAGGLCEIASCAAGYADCNGIFPDGCETDISQPSDCGSCGNDCQAPAPPNAVATCGGSLMKLSA